MQRAARPDAGVLRVLRLALVGARPLAAGAPGADVPAGAVRGDRRGRRWRRASRPSTSPAEVKYLDGAGRAAFERPYGLAWLLQLAAELREWDDPQARRVGGDAASRSRTRPSSAVVGLAAEALEADPDRRARPDGVLVRPDPRLGAARPATADGGSLLVGRASATSTCQDRGCPFGWEPSGQDFLSPCLAEADLMRRVLPARRVRGVARRRSCRASRRTAARGWLDAGGRDRPDRPEARPPRRPQPQPGVDARGDRVGAAAGRSAPAGTAGRALATARPALRAVTGEHYEGGHWLGSFAVYLDDRTRAEVSLIPVSTPGSARASARPPRRVMPLRRA